MTVPKQTNDSSSLDEIQARIEALGEEIMPYDIGEIPFDEKLWDLREELQTLLAKRNQLLLQN